ncbi:MAG: hypothetical protein JWQ72_872 [Polaromonas sp.]|nr:hypothetical protein [Polaromonas sp.]
MKKKMVQAALAVTLGCTLLLGSVQAQTAEPAAQPAQVKKKKKSAGKVKSAAPKFLPGSQETVKERSNRLKRECKGAVNAGACSGYTS